MLTIVLNVAVRVLPGAGRRVGRWIEKATAPEPGEDDRRGRVIVPWKAMIVGSIGLTIVLNLVLWVA
ncbi:MAG: hypothetical protein U5K30_11075 [Acidimicrobiales bacterium]|nr:hypothetical protein [Acidimicrobiales bacterium]